MVTGSLPSQEEMAPSSESKMNRPGLPLTAKPAPVVLATIPVGEDNPVFAAECGTAKDPAFMPLALYKVVKPELLSEIQNALFGK